MANGWACRWALADCDDEIFTQTSLGVRSTFQNAGTTRRSGLEASWNGRFQRHLQARMAAKLIDARFADVFAICSGAPCATPNRSIAAGNHIPGVARGSMVGAIDWKPPTGWRGGIELRHLSSVVVNDLNREAAPAFTVATVSIGHLRRFGDWQISGFVRISTTCSANTMPAR